MYQKGFALVIILILIPLVITTALIIQLKTNFFSNTLFPEVKPNTNVVRDFNLSIPDSNPNVNNATLQQAPTPTPSPSPQKTISVLDFLKGRPKPSPTPTPSPVTTPTIIPISSPTPSPTPSESSTSTTTSTTLPTPTPTPTPSQTSTNSTYTSSDGAISVNTTYVEQTLSRSGSLYGSGFTITNTSATGFDLILKSGPSAYGQLPVYHELIGFYESSGGLTPGIPQNVRVHIDPHLSTGWYTGSYTLKYLKNGSWVTGPDISWKITVTE